MYLHEFAMDSFVLVHADWTVGQACRVIRKLKPTHVIVRRTEDRDYYYLYTRYDILVGIGRQPEPVTVKEILDLHEHDASPTSEAFAQTSTAPGESLVILDNGQIIGFFDPDPALSDLDHRRVLRGGDDEDKPIPRSLVTEFPQQVRLGETASLLAWLSSQAGRGAALTTALPADATVDILVQPKRGFELDGSAERSLTVSGQGETLPVQFRLRASNRGPARLRVLAFHSGQAIADVTIAPMVLPALGDADGTRRTHGEPATRLIPHQPDLSLLILEHESAGKPAFTFRLTATDPSLDLHLEPFGPVQLESDPLQYFHGFFKDIEELPLGDAHECAVAERRVAAKGSVLFETVLPERLRELLWTHRKRIQSVRVDSEEPWIPWELCRLHGREDGEIVEGPFLCEAYTTTRWLPGIGLKPALSLRNIALVVPQDSGLPYAASERDYVLSLASGGRRVDRVGANYLDITDGLKSGQYDCWHFTGHGGFQAPDPNRSIMVLEDQETLTPEDLGGVVKNLGRARPFVFLNACQIGRAAMSLTDIGGWAKRFLENGAAAFVGAHWSVYDRAAHDFAVELYTRLLAGVPVGKAAQEARNAVKSLGDPTWLAYVVFAHPLAVVAQ